MPGRRPELVRVKPAEAGRWAGCHAGRVSGILGRGTEVQRWTHRRPEAEPLAAKTLGQDGVGLRPARRPGGYHRAPPWRGEGFAEPLTR